MIQREKITQNKFKFFFCASILFLLWLVLYFHLEAFSEGLVRFLGVEKGKAGEALHFFLYDTAKIMMLLVLMVYVLALLRASLNTDKVRDFLGRKSRATGYVCGAFLGAVTPFCSCSSIPVFLSFVQGGIPLGMTMSFLIASPIINEVAVVLLWGILGWKFTLFYIVTGLSAGILGGMLMDALHAERWLQPILKSGQEGGRFALPVRMTLERRHAFAVQETRKIVSNVWKWVMLGVAVGAMLHGFVPEELVEAHLGAGRWWDVPLAVMAGIPLYTNVTGIVPVMESLLIKGVPFGTTLAFCLSTVAISLPELIMLRQVMKSQLLLLFVLFLLLLFTVAGWLFNMLV